MRLTEHFTLQEFLRKEDIAGVETIPERVVENIKRLANVLERIRSIVCNIAEADERIIVVSGYRSPISNRRAGGARHSLHLEGRAADIRLQSGIRLPLILASLAVDEVGGLGIYYGKTTIHVDTGNRRYWGDDYHAASFIPTLRRIIADELQHIKFSHIST